MDTRRELDAIIARSIFRKPHVRLNNFDVLIDGYGIEIPYYSTNIKDSWEVVELLNAMGFGVGVYTQKNFECAVDVHYDTQSTTTYDFGSGDTVAREKTAPLAICKAALKIVGI